MSSAIVIAMYSPKKDKETDFDRLINIHIPTLREFGLITDREPIIAKSSDGTVLEIFEWVDESAPARAHEHPAVAKIWAEMGEIGRFETLGSLAEAGKTFPHFKPLN